MRTLIAFLLLLTASVAHAELPSATATVVKVLVSGMPTVIDLGARTCIPCKKMAPILEGLSSEYQGKANLFFIDVNKESVAAERFKIRMIPTQIFFDAKGQEVKRHIGFMYKTDLLRGLKSAGLK